MCIQDCGFVFVLTERTQIATNAPYTVGVCSMYAGDTNLQKKNHLFNYCSAIRESIPQEMLYDFKTDNYKMCDDAETWYL